MTRIGKPTRQSRSIAGRTLALAFALAMLGSVALVALFRVAEADVLLPAASFSVRGPFASGDDIRDLAFDGTRIWVANYGSHTVQAILR